MQVTDRTHLFELRRPEDHRTDLVSSFAEEALLVAVVTVDDDAEVQPCGARDVR